MIKIKEVNYAVMIIEELKDEWYKKPSTWKMKKSSFEEMSYQRYALDEIKTYILQNQDMHPIDCLYEFRHQLNEKAATTMGAEANFVYLIIADVCRDVCDILMGMC